MYAPMFRNQGPILVFFLAFAASCAETVKGAGNIGQVPNESGLCSQLQSSSLFRQVDRSDNHYQITVARGAAYLNSYVTGQTYTVVLSSSKTGHTFRGFNLIAVPHRSSDESVTVGSFDNIGGQQTVLDAVCPNVVKAAANFVPRSEVLILWTAPAAVHGLCVEFRAAVTVNGNDWYQDDDGLTKVLCGHRESIAIGERNIETPASRNPECCACGTAKYLLTFRGLWPQRSRLSDSPNRHAVVHWSSVIGASHSERYVMWDYGIPASRGVADVCEYGDARLIEDEMHQHSMDIRTVIKTPGMRRSEAQGNDQQQQQRWAHFSTDRRHHQLSLLAQVGPSTDWCVGVTGLDLCLANCSWASDLVVELTPWDAGVSDGVQYIADRRKSDPAQPIHRLNNTFPEDPTSPFFGIASVQPLAVLRLRRLQPKPDEDPEQRECHSSMDRPASSSVNDGGDETGLETERPALGQESVAAAAAAAADGSDIECPVTSWGEWSACTALCGLGTSTRARAVLPRPDRRPCISVPLHEGKVCDTTAACTDSNDMCAVTSWSPWSDCRRGGAPCSSSSSSSSSINDDCTRRRQRTFVIGGTAELMCNATTEEEEKCPVEGVTSLHAVDSLQKQHRLSRCTQPAEAGPCEGRMLRWFFDGISRRCRTFRYSGCGGSGNRFDSEMECIRVCMRDGSHQLSPPVSSSSTARSVDHTPTNSAATRAHERLLGIGGNVGARREVAAVTMVYTSRATTSDGRRTIEEQRSTITSTTTAATAMTVPNLPADTVSCAVSQWSAWSQCSASCGDGAHRLRRRIIEMPPRNGGRGCTRRLEELQSCRLPPCGDSGGRGSAAAAAQRCRYGPWSSWSACAKSCGADSVQERMRRVTSADDSDMCTVRVSRRYCSLPPCVAAAVTSDGI